MRAQYRFPSIILGVLSLLLFTAKSYAQTDEARIEKWTPKTGQSFRWRLLCWSCRRVFGNTLCVDRVGGLSLQTLMPAFTVVHLDPSIDAGTCFRYAVVGLQVDFLVFEAAPQTFD